MASSTAIHPFHWHYHEVDDESLHVRGHSLLVLVPIIIFLAVLLFFIVLCLYTRWVCWFCRRSTVESSSSSESSSSQPSGLGPDAISSISVQLHGTSKGDEDQCSICLGCLAEGEKVKVLPGCSHEFHPGCVDEWLRSRSSCPLCRAPLGGSTVQVATEV